MIVWDVWDHHTNSTENKTLLHNTFEDYFTQMQDSLLHNAETGIMNSIHEMEESMVESLRNPSS
ncbi:MAG TPA: hypothetical protein EYG38_08190 [Verrucomicrobia bacterium]|nr:hypothetical protein [Verrucomicrobiota bacterium]